MPGNRFELGILVATPRATERYTGQQLATCLGRHMAGDWGDISEPDFMANGEALLAGTRLFSAYLMPDREELWIITEADRSKTTMLTPYDY